MDIYFEKKEGEKERILEEGEYNGFKYQIVSYGSHPCSYIQIPKEHFLNEANGYDEIEVEAHGGLTYMSERDDGHTWIGWDYAHYGDYSHYPQLESSFRDRKLNKQWTLGELQAHVKEVIDSIPKLKKWQEEKYYFAEKQSEWR